jgi:hypothetical protein
MTIENNPQGAAPVASTPAKPTVAAKPAAKSTTAKPAAKSAPKAKAKPAAEGNYKVLTGIDDSEFCARVSDHLKHGWALHGSVAATFNGKNVILAQPLVRKKKFKGKK